MKEYWKAILAFLGLLATNIATELMRGPEFWPTNWGSALRWAVTVIAGTWLVYRVPNATQPKQFSKHLKQNGLKTVPVDETLPPAPGALP